MTSINIATIFMIICFAFVITRTIADQVETFTKNQAEGVVNSLKLSATEFIWNINNAALKTITDKMIEDKIIDQVVFKDQNGTELAKSTDVEDIGKSFQPKTIKGDIVYGADNKVIGSIELIYNLNAVKEVRDHILKVTIVAILIVQFIIAIIIFLILRSTNKKLENEVIQLKNITVNTMKTSETSNTISQEVSAATMEQAASIQETVATLHEITEMVNSSVNNATKSSEYAAISHTNALAGLNVVQDMILSMNQINDSNSGIMNEVNQSNNRINEIVSVINEISSKTNIINDIVFQTKLLSFNASVEAARAGEHGKGFAVVAEEVGNLAQMSGNAAKEISILLNESIQKVNSIVSETSTGVEKVLKDGNEKVHRGIETANKCDSVLNEIVKNTISVKEMMNEVVMASKEQAVGVQNISNAMTQIDQMVHANQNAALKSAEASGQLLKESENLKTSVSNIEEELFGSKHSLIIKEPKEIKTVFKNENKKISTSDVKKELKPEKTKTINDKKEIPTNVIAIKDAKKDLKKDGEKKPLPALKKEEVKVTHIEKKVETKNTNDIGTGPIPSHEDKRFEDV
jgi:methyl-accepting chemotaxis protein